jgi:hypothetical protein
VDHPNRRRADAAHHIGIGYAGVPPTNRIELAFLKLAGASLL